VTASARSRFAPRAVEVSYRADGTIVLRSQIPLDGCERHICAYLERWAGEAPDRTFLAQRDGTGEWRHLPYAEAWARARGIAQALLDRGLGPDRPLAILTGNSIEHALMTFGAMIAGVPVAPISPAYSASAGGRRRLAEIAAILRPGMIFAQSAAALGDVRAMPELAGLPWITVEPTDAAERLADVERVAGHADADRAYAAATGATVAKILFTSGSTGSPKGVPTRKGCCAARSAPQASCFPSTRPRSRSTGCRGTTRWAATARCTLSCVTAARCTSTAAARCPACSTRRCAT
jgi:feruloyl-CoA synthase